MFQKTLQKNRVKRLLLPICFLFLFTDFKIFAQDISVSGFIRNYNAITTSGKPELLVGRNRLGLDASKELSQGRLYISSQILNSYSDSLESLEYRLREAYFDVFLSSVDIRIGKQFIPLGLSNGAFLTDILNPIDLSEFLTQDIVDIRQGVPAAKITWYFSDSFLQGFIIPVSTSNRFSRPGDRFFPFQGFDSAFPIAFADSSRQITNREVQGGLRLGYREKLSWQVDFLALYVNNPNPAFQKSFQISNNFPAPTVEVILTPTLNRSLVFAANGSLNLTNSIILKGETAYFRTRKFDFIPQNLRSINFQNPTLEDIITLSQTLLNAGGETFVRSKPFITNMAGIQTTLSGWTIEGQLVSEHILQYNEDILQNQHFYVGSLLLQKPLFRDKLTLYHFGRYSFTGNDFWLNPEIRYEFSDGIIIASGFQFFGGESPSPFFGHFSFKNFASDSFGYLKLSAFF